MAITSTRYRGYTSLSNQQSVTAGTAMHTIYTVPANKAAKVKFNIGTPSTYYSSNGPQYAEYMDIYLCSGNLSSYYRYVSNTFYVTGYDSGSGHIHMEFAVGDTPIIGLYAASNSNNATNASFHIHEDIENPGFILTMPCDHHDALTSPAYSPGGIGSTTYTIQEYYADKADERIDDTGTNSANSDRFNNIISTPNEFYLFAGQTVALTMVGTSANWTNLNCKLSWDFTVLEEDV